MTTQTDAITAKGYKKDTITFDGTTITIKRGRLSRQAGSIKHIPLSSVQAIQYTPAKIVRNGYIAFTLAGGNELQGLHQAARNENAVVFTPNKHQVAEFDALYRAIAAAKGITA